MDIKLGPTGHTIIGHVLDINRSALERRLRRYDPQLYLKWNPAKKAGFGVWELRRRPEKKSIVASYNIDGILYHQLEYHENPLECHIKDWDILDYKILEWVRKQDVWARINFDPLRPERVSRFSEKMDDDYYQQRYALEDKMKAERHYNLMQDKKIFKRFQEDLLSGINPAQLAAEWGRIKRK